MPIKDFAEIVGDIIPFVQLIGALIGTFLYCNTKPIYKDITIYLGMMFLTSFLSYLLGYVLLTNNFIVLYIYSFTELAFMLYFYKKHMFLKKQRFLIILAWIGLAYIIAEVLLIFVFKELDVKQFQPYAKVADNFAVILMALAYLHERVSLYSESKWGSFRLNMVFLVFFTLNTLIFLPFNFLVNEQSGIKFYFWTGNIILILLFYMYLSFEIINNGLSNKIKKA